MLQHMHLRISEPTADRLRHIAFTERTTIPKLAEEIIQAELDRRDNRAAAKSAKKGATK